MLLQLEPHKDPWQDLVYGPIVYDVASIEGDPVSDNMTLVKLVETTVLYVSTGNIRTVVFGYITFTYIHTHKYTQTHTD